MCTWIVERNYIKGLEIGLKNIDWIQGVTNFLICSNILIFLDKLIHMLKYFLDIRAKNVFKKNFIELFKSFHTNIQIYMTV